MTSARTPIQVRIAAAKAALGALLLATTALFSPPAASAGVLQPARSEETRLEHISIRVMGSGSPVILIPGLASPRAVWDGVAPELAGRHRVYLVQVNGFGGDAPGANLKPGVLDGVVSDLNGYIGHQKLGPCAVVGHSMGGLVGLMLARSHPDDVSRLMLVDALPYFAVLMAPPGVNPTPEMVAPQAAMMRDKVAANYGKTLDAATIDAQVRGMALNPDSVAKLRTWAASADLRVTAEAMFEDLTTDLRSSLSAIRAPITLVYPWSAAGPTKELAEPFYRKQFASAPSITFIDVGDSAHFVMLDQPQVFKTALDNFLR